MTLAEKKNGRMRNLEITPQKNNDREGNSNMMYEELMTLRTKVIQNLSGVCSQNGKNLSGINLSWKIEYLTVRGLNPGVAFMHSRGSKKIPTSFAVLLGQQIYKIYSKIISL